MAAINEISDDQSLASITLQRDAVREGNFAGSHRARGAGPGVLSLGHNAVHQISGASYDGLRRITDDGVRNYTWNLTSELTAYAGADASASFGYDAFGVRTSATAADGTTQNYVLQYALGLPSIATVQAGCADQRYYVFLPGGALRYVIEAADNSHHYYHFDDSVHFLLVLLSVADLTATRLGTTRHHAAQCLSGVVAI